MQSRPDDVAGMSTPGRPSATRKVESIGIVLLLVVAGLAFMVAFVCLASEGTEGMTEEEIQQAGRNERTCLLIALPVSVVAGGVAIALDRRRGKRRRPPSGASGPW